jgi:hypothetical protein
VALVAECGVHPLLIGRPSQPSSTACLTRSISSTVPRTNCHTLRQLLRRHEVVRSSPLTWRGVSLSSRACSAPPFISRWRLCALESHPVTLQCLFSLHYTIPRCKYSSGIRRQGIGYISLKILTRLKSVSLFFFLRCRRFPICLPLQQVFTPMALPMVHQQHRSNFATHQSRISDHSRSLSLAPVTRASTVGSVYLRS